MNNAEKLNFELKISRGVFPKKMMSESLGNFRTSDVRLVRLMSKWGTPHLYCKGTAIFYTSKFFVIIFYKKV